MLVDVCLAQVTLDGSLGPQGPLAGPNYRIYAHLGKIRGSNLFHSFDQFNVPTGGSATFSGPAEIKNILSRVTGGQPSSIDGVLRSEIDGANLYLLNPSGVLFGPNAKLDVRGSFHVSTADFLRFADGTTFSAHLGQQSVLTVAAPAAFGFLGNTPAAITIQGSTLKVPDGKAISVVGGDITLVGGPLTADGCPTLGTSGGRVQLASVASPGEVGFNSLELVPDLQVNSFRRLGRITLSQQARVDASGDGGGTVLIRSGHLLVDGSGIFADNKGAVDGIGVGVDLRVAADVVIMNESFITADRNSTGRARDLQITAGSLHMDNSGLGSSGSGAGNGGNVLVNVGTLTLTGGAQIAADTSNTGNGGELTIRATDGILISGRGTRLGPSGLFTNTFGDGDAGRLLLSAPTLSMMEGGLIQAGVADDSSGKAGSIEVRVGRLTLTGGAQISTSSFGTGSGGEVSIAATKSISIAGRDREGNSSGLFSTTGKGGRGGNLQVTAPQFRIGDGATISAESTGLGNAGNVTVAAGDTFVSTNGSVVTRATQADGGNIQITAPTLVRLRDSAITAEVGGGATTVGGNITIDPQFVVLQNSQIVANAFQGRGGNIRIQAQQVFLADPASLVSASSALGINGQVNIQAPVTSISGAVAPLPQAFAQTAELLRSRCVERLREGTVSRFVVGGRDGVPLEPGSLLLSPLARAGQAGGVPGEERESYNSEAQPGWAWEAQAPAPGGLEVECARWRGQLGTAGPPQRRR